MSVRVSEKDNASLLGDLQQDQSLPNSWYLDPAIVELEYERIFHRTWQYVGNAVNLAKTGDYVTASVGRIPVIVVRSESGISALVNVCRHRRHLVMSGIGNAKSLRCPYHGWTYDIEGCLIAAPQCDSHENFRKEQFPLVSLRVDTWGPFIFVNADPHARPLAHYLGDVPDIIARNGANLAQMRLHSRDDWRHDANWKIMIENFIECYHCPLTHPGLSEIVNLGPNHVKLENGELYATQTAPVRASSLVEAGRRLPYDLSGSIATAQYHYVWPNFTININPGRPNLSLDVWLPDGTGHTKGFSEHYFAADVPVEYAEKVIAVNRQVSDEDNSVTESVQRGIEGGVPEQSCFLHPPDRLVVWFQKLVRNALK